MSGDHSIPTFQPNLTLGLTNTNGLQGSGDLESNTGNTVGGNATNENVPHEHAGDGHGSLSDDEAQTPPPPLSIPGTPSVSVSGGGRSVPNVGKSDTVSPEARSGELSAVVSAMRSGDAAAGATQKDISTLATAGNTISSQSDNLSSGIGELQAREGEQAKSIVACTAELEKAKKDKEKAQQCGGMPDKVADAEERIAEHEQMLANKKDVMGFIKSEISKGEAELASKNAAGGSVASKQGRLQAELKNIQGSTEGLDSVVGTLSSSSSTTPTSNKVAPVGATT